MNNVVLKNKGEHKRALFNITKTNLHEDIIKTKIDIKPSIFLSQLKDFSSFPMSSLCKENEAQEEAKQK